MKIYITGPAGSGKSTLAQKLGEHYGVPVIHLDELQWNPDWTEKENYHDLQKEAILKPHWIIEGASCSIVKKMPEVDRILILDYPPVGNMYRILSRYIKTRLFGKKRRGILIPERFSFTLLYKTFIWKRRQFPRLQENIISAGIAGKILILKDLHSAFETMTKTLDTNYYFPLQNATKGDCQKIADFINTYIHPRFLTVLSKDEAEILISKETKSSVLKSMERGDIFYLILDENSKIKALVSGRRKDEKTMYLGKLYVRPDCQGIGFGSRLLSRVEQKFRMDGYEWLVLETQKKFDWAVNFYIKNDYLVLTNENLPNSYFSKFYSQLVNASILFYKRL